MYIDMFHVSVIALAATMVMYGIVFGGMHPTVQMCRYDVLRYTFENSIASFTPFENYCKMHIGI